MKRWEQKELAQSLRKRGLSYREILAQVPFSLAKSTISQWCKHIELTPEQLDRLDQLYRTSSYRNRLLGSKANQRQRAAEVDAIRTRARAEVIERQKDGLWIAGLMLYWAEGAKTYHVALTNSDPAIIRFMMRWFREVCQVPKEKFRCYLNIHSGQDDRSIKAYWAQVVGLPLSQFGKSYVKKEGTGHRKNTLYHGTIRISVSNRNLLHRIRGWIAGFREISCGPLA